jgi:hypothetical protein
VLTRSPFELLRRLRACGARRPARRGHRAGVGRGLGALRARALAVTQPTDPFVSVQYRGYWFWVESNDIASKRGFSAMQTLLLSCLQENQAKPRSRCR